MHRPSPIGTLPLSLIFLASLSVACGGGGRGGGSAHSDAGGILDDTALGDSGGGNVHDGGDGEADIGDENAGEDGGLFPDGGGEVEVPLPEMVAVSAPDHKTVMAVFSRPLDVQEVSNHRRLRMTSAAGDLEVLPWPNWDPETLTLRIRTEPQKIGVEYELQYRHGIFPGTMLTRRFLSADSHHFWITDFSNSTYGSVSRSFHRQAMGAQVVIYTEEGYNLAGADQMVEEFDERIFPILTQRLYPAPDMDRNGKVIILALDGGYYFGGYFSPVNQYLDSYTSLWWGLRSNEAEIVHINVLLEPEYLHHTVAHEFQHLLYHARRGLTDPYWEYHDEGLAESAIHMVYGSNEMAVWYYEQDPEDQLRDGLSLVKWGYGDYSYYAQSYLFMTYGAALLTGDLDGYAEIFHLETGSPEEMDGLFLAVAGVDFMTAHRDSLIALRVAHESGPYSYQGMLPGEPIYLPAVRSGVSGVDLLPFAGAFFPVQGQGITYPLTAGENIVYAAVHRDGGVDLQEPFDLADGWILAYNRNWDGYEDWQSEYSGPDLAMTPPPPLPSRGGPPFHQCAPVGVPTWMNPPPRVPGHSEAMDRWRLAAKERLQKVR